MNVEKLNQLGGIEKCQQWLDSCSSSVVDEVSDETCENSVLDSEQNVFRSDEVDFKNKIVNEKNDMQAININQIIKKQPNNYNKIQIFKSRKVHIGDVIHINGPIYVNQYQNIPVTKENISRNDIVVYDGFDDLAIQRRKNWIAQSPLEPWMYLKNPAKFVIIVHSATEEAFTESENRYLVRVMQDKHILIKNYNDIAYNFLIGSDGTIFEGLGWKVQGTYSHNNYYNECSIGICFIGRFEEHPPPDAAIEKAKALIKIGIEIGTIAEDYTLLAHCQISTTTSPGEKLYEEVKTWENWVGTVGVSNPADV